MQPKMRFVFQFDLKLNFLKICFPQQLQQYRSGAILPSSDGSKENGDGDKVKFIEFFFLNVISGLSYIFFYVARNRVEELVLMVMAVRIKIQLIMQLKHMNFRLLLRNR